MTAPGLDWTVRDVLVGVLHNEVQLQANLTHRFYHIPAKLLTVPPESVRTVALYQSRRLFGETGAGVRVYGRTAYSRTVPRGAITEIPTRRPDERYHRFEVREWVELPRRIRAGGVAPGVYLLTNEFLLQNSRCVPELYIRSAAQLETYVRLRQAAARTRRTGGSELVPAQNGNTVMVAGDVIGIYTPDGRYLQHSLREFLAAPYDFLETMRKYI